MPLAFPVIKCPSSRTLTPGAYPVRQFVAINGATTTIIRGDRASGARLSIEYRLLADTDAALVWALWNDSLGGFRDVDLPANAYEGIDPALIAQIPSYLSWYLDGEPSVESVQPGLSRMRLELIGRLEA